MIRQVARCAISVDFEGSAAWNDKLGPNQVGFHARESTAHVGGLDTFNMESILAENDYSSTSSLHAPNVGTLPGSGVKYTLVMGNEYGSSRSYSLAPRPDEVSHVTVAAALNSRVMPETQERIQNANTRFEKNVYNFLRIIKPFSFI